MLFSHLSNTLAPPWRWDDWFSPYEQMLRAMGSAERSRCPGPRPCHGGFNHAVDLYHTPVACWESLETVRQNTGCYACLRKSTARVVFQLGFVGFYQNSPGFTKPAGQLSPLFTADTACVLLLQSFHNKCGREKWLVLSWCTWENWGTRCILE